MSEREHDDFLAAGQAKDRGLVRELFAFMGENKAWWMLPLLIVFGLLGALLVISAVAPGAVPFIYPLFGA